MTGLDKIWAGRIYGTNTGNLFIEFDRTGPDVSGTLRLNDPIYGVAVYAIQGTFDESLLVTGKPLSAKEGVELGEISVEARLTSEGHLRGRWESTLGDLQANDSRWQFVRVDEGMPHHFSGHPNGCTGLESLLEWQILGH